MSDDYKTLRVPEDDWETAREQKEAAGRTWGEQIVRPDGDNDSTIPPIAGIREQLDRIEQSVGAAKEGGDE